MPIAQITVSERLAPSVRDRADEITASIVAILTNGLHANPDLVQVTFTATIAPPFGREVLCQVFHRASDVRTAEVRAAVADRLRDTLHQFTGQSVRVRLMALDSAVIAASDTPETSA